MEAFRTVGSEVRMRVVGCDEGVVLIGHQPCAKSTAAWSAAFARLSREEQVRVLKLRREVPELPEDYETSEYAEAASAWAHQVLVEFADHVECAGESFDAEEVFYRLPPSGQVVQGLSILSEVGALPAKFRAVVKSAGDTADEPTA